MPAKISPEVCKVTVNLIGSKMASNIWQIATKLAKHSRQLASKSTQLARFCFAVKKTPQIGNIFLYLNGVIL